MKKALIIIGIILVFVVVGYFILKKVKTTTTTGTMAAAPSRTLGIGQLANDETNESRINSHATWLAANGASWVSSIKTQYSFATTNQASVFLGIQQGKTDNKDISLTYAGNSDAEVAAWVKKYVA